MSITAENQPIVFLLCALCGIIIGIIFDLFRVHRTFFKVSKVSLVIADLIFWVLSGFVALEFIIWANNGVLRVFEFIGISVGAFVYLMFISKFFRKIATFVFRLLNILAKFVLKIILFPIVFIIKRLKKPFFAVVYGFKAGGKRFKRFAKKI